MIQIEDIKQRAQHFGACALADNPKTWGELCRTMFLPQGIEFIQQYPDFLSVEDFRSRADEIRPHNIYVDECSTYHNPIRAAYVGDMAYGTIICRNPKELHTIVVMHGATVEITAENYAVVRVYNIGGRVITHCDKTSKIIV